MTMWMVLILISIQISCALWEMPGMLQLEEEETKNASVEWIGDWNVILKDCSGMGIGILAKDCENERVEEEGS